MRIDAAMMYRGLVKSRSRAKLLLKDGKVLLNGRTCTKPSEMVETEDEIQIFGGLPYVGRGGLKLERALEFFSLDVSERICLDIGASTGGFTDCMLQNGACLVYAVDVGHDQLDETLRKDARVVCMEGTDIRNVPDLPETPSFCGIDVSFISLRLVLPAAYRLLMDKGDCAVLIKPQFEAGKKGIGKGGIVRSARVHVQVLEEILAFSRSIGFSVQGLCPSPVRGGSGNAEYLMHLTKQQELSEPQLHLSEIVRAAGVNGG